MSSGQMYSHRVPFSANDLLLVSALAYAMLSDPAFASELASEPERGFDHSSLRDLRERLKVFIRRGLSRQEIQSRLESTFVAQVANSSLEAAESPLPFEKALVNFEYAEMFAQLRATASAEGENDYDATTRTAIDRHDQRPCSGLERSL